jgi:hypothetical protein
MVRADGIESSNATENQLTFGAGFPQPRQGNAGRAQTGLAALLLLLSSLSSLSSAGDAAT